MPAITSLPVAWRRRDHLSWVQGVVDPGVLSVARSSVESTLIRQRARRRDLLKRIMVIAVGQSQDFVKKTTAPVDITAIVVSDGNQRDLDFDHSESRRNQKSLTCR